MIPHDERACKTATGCGQRTGETACPAGTFQDATEKAGCKGCGAGMYQNETGKAACKHCPGGTHQGIDGTHQDIADTGGPNRRTSELTSHTRCYACDPG